jgi:hypothetical protein
MVIECTGDNFSLATIFLATIFGAGDNLWRQFTTFRMMKDDRLLPTVLESPGLVLMVLNLRLNQVRRETERCILVGCRDFRMENPVHILFARRITMKGLRCTFLAGIALMGMAAVANAAPLPICGSPSGQSVAVGLSCTLGGLTFTFEEVAFTGVNSGADALALATPPTSASTPGVVVLGFTVLATYPADIELVYEVTGGNITAIDSTFGPPDTGEIFESACANDPTKVPPGCGTPLATVTNTTGAFTISPTFGPVSQIWIDKDITDNGFSTFTDSVETSVPEPSSLWLLGSALSGLAVLARKFRVQ